jgi:predicted metal-dependent phosphoesterase TrpH
MKADLHTHSVASPDGSLTEQHYRRMLDSGRLDYIAVTDHNTIAFAEELRRKLGPRIIVGEEINTLDGEIIGLYLKKRVKPGMSAAETAVAIRKQGGLIYVPHPFETVRKGMRLDTLAHLVDWVDIIETNNGRAVFQNKSQLAREWAAMHQVAGAASSDAHGWHGWGKTYSLLKRAPTNATLPDLLAAATYKAGRPGLRGMLYPKFNRIRRRKR